MDEERARDTSIERESESAESEEWRVRELETGRLGDWESGSREGGGGFWDSEIETFHAGLKKYYFLPHQRCQLGVCHVWVST